MTCRALNSPWPSNDSVRAAAYRNLTSTGLASHFLSQEHSNFSFAPPKVLERSMRVDALGKEGNLAIVVGERGLSWLIWRLGRDLSEVVTE